MSMVFEKRIILCLTIIYLSFVAGFTYAAPVYQKETVVYYGNGVLSEYHQSLFALELLERKVLRAIGDPAVESLLSFEVAYNRTHKPTHGLLDVLEAYIQSGQSFSIHFWHWLAGLDAFVDPGFQTLMYPLLAELAEQAALLTNANVQEHTERYNRQLLKCKRVVVVAHFQGNFYANIAATGIEQPLASAFGIVSVANPASYVEGDGPYTTLTEDLVIAFIPGSKTANFDNYGLFESYSPLHGHAFVGNYLSPNHDAEIRVVGHVIDEINRVMNVDTSDYCGWPASYGTANSLYREPSDMRLFAGLPYSALWDLVIWPAVLRDDIVVEYRVGRSGSWTALTQSKLSLGATYSWGLYEANRLPDRIAPFFYFNDRDINGGQSLNFTIEVQPDDADFGDLKGIQQYRIILDNKVIDQFTLDYDSRPWSPVKASGPILESIPATSNPIQLIQ